MTTAQARTVRGTRPRPLEAHPPTRWYAVAVGIASVVVLISFLARPLTGVNVYFYPGGVAPISGRLAPRIGPGTLPALLLAAAALRWGARLAATLAWRWLLPVAYLAGAAWLTALATVDGRAGIAGILTRNDEYLPTARGVHSIPEMIRTFISRIPFSAAPHNWSVNVAGHPPGALLLFVSLIRVGLGGDLAVGITVIVIAATTPLAVVMTLRRLGAGTAARRAAPFLVFGPAAIWSAVSADAVFTAVAAWGAFLLARGLTTRSRARVVWTLAAGAVLGYCLFLSYGLTLFVFVVLALLALTGRWRLLPWAAAGAAGVVAAWALAGFAWWKAYPVLSDRYWAGVAHLRPGWYWTVGNLALLCVSAGPVVVPALTAAAHTVRVRALAGEARVVTALVVAGTAAVAVADVSQFSRAEVERIWLPFTPWILIGVALLPRTLRRWGLLAQVTVALLVQSLLRTLW